MIDAILMWIIFISTLIMFLVCFIYVIRLFFVPIFWHKSHDNERSPHQTLERQQPSEHPTFQFPTSAPPYRRRIKRRM